MKVQVKGTSIGAITDIGGNYTLSLPNRDAILTFSFIGYVAQETPLSNRTTVNVTLVADISQLDEVVVIGYGTVNKVN